MPANYSHLRVLEDAYGNPAVEIRPGRIVQLCGSDRWRVTSAPSLVRVITGPQADWAHEMFASCPETERQRIRRALGLPTPPAAGAKVTRLPAPSGNRDHDYFRAECLACGWTGGHHSNRTIEGRTLAERDASQHRCPR